MSKRYERSKDPKHCGKVVRNTEDGSLWTVVAEGLDTNHSEEGLWPGQAPKIKREINCCLEVVPYGTDPMSAQNMEQILSISAEAWDWGGFEMTDLKDPQYRERLIDEYLKGKGV